MKYFNNIQALLKKENIKKTFLDSPKNIEFMQNARFVPELIEKDIAIIYEGKGVRAPGKVSGSAFIPIPLGNFKDSFRYLLLEVLFTGGQLAIGLFEES